MLPILSSNPTMASLGMATGPVNRLDSFFDRVFGEGASATGSTRSWTPIALWQDDDHLFIEAEMPGLSENDIEVTVQNDVLSIRGDRKPEEGRNYLYNGRSYGRFERTIILPEVVKTDEVRATLNDGVLHIALPKSPESKPKRIAVAAS